MQCDMCGKAGKLFNALVEGSEMVVCKDCLRFGKIVRHAPRYAKKEFVTKKPEPEESVEMIVRDYAQLIKRARENKGLKQEDIAAKLNEKESLLQKVESGKIIPSLRLARKLEKFFDIRLVEEYKKEAVIQQKKSSDALTIGDLIKI